MESTALTQAGLVIGSPGFMSPEQAMGHEVGPPTDIFSLGAVLAFAATGQGPFGTGTTASLLYRVVHGSPSLDQVPAEVRPLIERCLAKDPRQRPTADGLLAEVGALQPTTDWLPISIIPAAARDTGSGPAPAEPGFGSTPGRGAAAAAGAAAGLGAAAQTTAAGPGAQLPSGESQLLAAPASHSLTPSSKSMTPAPGATHPSGPGYPPANTYPPGGVHTSGGPYDPPGGRNRTRRRLWRPLVLAWIIGGLIAASAAGFAVTAFTGHTPTPVQSPAAQISSPAVRTGIRVYVAAVEEKRQYVTQAAMAYPDITCFVD